MYSRDPDFPHEEYGMIVGATAPGTTRQFHNRQSMTVMDNSSSASSTKYIDILMADIMCDARPSGVVLPKILRRKVVRCDDSMLKAQDNQRIRAEEDSVNQLQQHFRGDDESNEQGIINDKTTQFQNACRVNVDSGGNGQQQASSQQKNDNTESFDNLTLLQRLARYDDSKYLHTDSYLTHPDNNISKSSINKDEDGGEEEEDLDAFLPARYEPPPSYANISLDPSAIFTTSEIEQKLAKANAALIEIHKQLHKGEELYFQDTDHHGNLYKGWDAFIDSKADHLGIGFANLDGDGSNGSGAGVGMMDRIMGDHSRIGIGGGGLGSMSGTGNKASGGFMNQGHSGPSPPTRRMPADYRWFSSSAYSAARDRGSNGGRAMSERKRSGSRRSISNSNASSTLSSVSAPPTISNERIPSTSFTAADVNTETINTVAVAVAYSAPKESLLKREGKKVKDATQLMPPPMSTSTVKKINEIQVTTQSLSSDPHTKSVEGGEQRVIEGKHNTEGSSNIVKLKDSVSKSSIIKDTLDSTGIDHAVKKREVHSLKVETPQIGNGTAIPKKNHGGIISTAVGGDGSEKDANHGSMRMNEKHKRNRKEKRDAGNLTNDTMIEKQRDISKKNDDHRDGKSSDSTKKKVNTNTAPRTFTSSFDLQNFTTKDTIDTNKTSTNAASVLSQGIPRKKRRVDPNHSNNLNSGMGGRITNTQVISDREATPSDAIGRSAVQAGEGLGSGMIPKKAPGDYSERSTEKEIGSESDRKRKKEHISTTTNAMKQLKKKDMLKASYGSEYNNSKWRNKGSDRRNKLEDTTNDDSNKKLKKRSSVTPSELNKSGSDRKGSDRKQKRENASTYDSKHLRKTDPTKAASVNSSNVPKKGHKGNEIDSNKKSHKGNERKYRRESKSPDESKQLRKMDVCKASVSGSISTNKSSGTKSKSRKQKSSDD